MTDFLIFSAISQQSTSLPITELLSRNLWYVSLWLFWRWCRSYIFTKTLSKTKMCLITRYGPMLEEFLYEISVVYFVLFGVRPNGLIFSPAEIWVLWNWDKSFVSIAQPPVKSFFFSDSAPGSVLLSISQSQFRLPRSKNKKSTICTYCHFEGVRNLVPNSLSNNIRITYWGLLKRRGPRVVFQIMKFGIVIFFNLAPTGKKLIQSYYKFREHNFFL